MCLESLYVNNLFFINLSLFRHFFPLAGILKVQTVQILVHTNKDKVLTHHTNTLLIYYKVGFAGVYITRETVFKYFFSGMFSEN